MAGSGFTRKKVESLTLGEKLRKLRNDLHMTLPDAARATHIQARYLEYLESGQYEKLPADVYVRGFLRSYARHLGVNEGALIKLYERERNIQQNLGNQSEKRTRRLDLPLSSLVITPRTVVLTLTAVVVLGLFGYLYQEFQRFAAEPRLVILEPLPGSVIEGSEVTLRGKTEKGARLSVNGEAVFVGSEGEFSEKLTLQAGLNTIAVLAINRFDKEKAETFSVEARFAPALPVDSATLSERAREETGFALEVSVRSPLAVTLSADGTVVHNGLLQPGESRRVEAKERISVSSENAAETLIRYPDGREEALGAESEPIIDREFLPSGENPEAGV